MAHLDHIRAMINYNYALFDKLWESIMELSDERFLAPLSYSHGSIRNQIIHVATTDIRWVRGLKEQPDSRGFSLNPVNYPTRSEARNRWASSVKEVMEFVSELDEDRLVYTPQGMYGPVWQILAHIVNHGTDHRAQILHTLHEFGAPTFDQDLILYFWGL
jgi:uncharacterized damage-inducible protein DinB